MNEERRQETIERAKKRGDKAAVAILEGGPRWQPDPADHFIFAAPIRRRAA